jgi:hypothetical protein
MSNSIGHCIVVAYIAMSLRILFEQIYFGYVLHNRRALFLVPFLCACAINLLRWPYIATCYPKLFAAEFLLGMRLKSQPVNSKAAKILANTEDTEN